MVFAAVISDGTGATTDGSNGRPNLVRDNGIYRSMDEGLTWKKITGPNPGAAALGPPHIGDGITVTDLEYTKDTKTGAVVLYAGVQNKNLSNDDVGGIWRSTDNGDNWTRLPVPVALLPRDGSVGRIAIATDHKQQIFAAVANNRPRHQLLKVIQSTNDGATWTDITPPLATQQQMNYNLLFGLNVTDLGDFLYLGAQSKLMEWYDGPLPGGRVWNDLVGVPANQTGVPHDDYHAIAFKSTDVLDPFYVGTDGGVWRHNFLGTWTDFNTSGLQTHQIFQIDQHPTNFGTLLAGSQDNGSAITTNTGTTWTTTFVGDTWRMRFDPKNANTAYETTNKGMFRSSDGGQTWPTDISIPRSVDPGGDKTQYMAMAIRPDDTRDLLVGSGSNVFRSRDQGATWAKSSNYAIPNEDQAAQVLALTYGKDGSGEWDVAYAGLRNGIVMETNNLDQNAPPGANWSARLNGGWGQRKITSIITDPQQPGVAYLTIGDFIDGANGVSGAPNDVNKIGQVWRTKDFGQTWDNLSGNRLQADSLPNVPVNTIVIDPTAPIQPEFGATGVFVGTDVGVYRGTWNGTKWSWQRFGSNFPMAQVLDLQVTSYFSGTQLVAATHGRGAWTITLPEQQPDAIPENDNGTWNLGDFQDPCGTNGPYTIAINWGDGSPLDTTSGRAVALSGGVVGVTGTHPYVHPGPYGVTVTITDPMCGPITLTKPVWISDAALTPHSSSVSGSSFTRLSNVTVATFTDADTGAALGNFSATINWGDGTSSPATISNNGSTFNVLGSHTYTNAGTFTITPTIRDSGGTTTTASSTATISGEVTAQATAFSPAEGVPDTSVTVATFTGLSGATYTASINWGDGHTTAGTVTANGTNFTVTGTNTYPEDGAYTLTVTISKSGTTMAVVANAVQVADSPLGAMGVSIAANQGAALTNVVVGRFVDGNPFGSPADYTATINFGDGNTATGTIVAEGNNVFAVQGSNTYLPAGTFPITVTVSDAGGSAVTINSTASITAVAPAVTGLDTLSGPPAGGTAVNIFGTALVGATLVKFGTVAATGFTVNADGSITAVAPAQAAGVVDITVTTPAGTSATSSADQFAYTASAPTVTGVSPNSGATGGGNSVTITGTNLAPATQVYFGSLPATSFTTSSNTSMTATAPAELAGTVDITVVTPYGTSAISASDHYTYNGTAPTVTGVALSSGPAAGGTAVFVTGTNLNGATSVKFGTTAATSFSVLDSGTILAVAPALTAGTYDITVTTPYGTSATSSADQFTAVVAPSVSGVGPSSGPTGGGTSVTVTGSGFTGASQVYFGSVAASAFTVNSDTSITATAPAQLSGTVDITVVTTGGTSAIFASDHYTYNATAPTVTAVSPNRGPTAGGTLVTITGTNFNGATQVTFGGVAATSVTILSATQITASAPAESAATVDVRVTTPYGTSATGAADQYTYADTVAPSVSSLNVTSGPMAGGTSVVITGSNFTAATAVLFGNVAATSYTVNSDTQITVTSPTQAAGQVDVQVVTPYGTSPKSPFDLFTYTAALPSVTSVSPNTGSTTGGTSVTITGSNFTGATRVYFGNVLATSFTFNSDSSITTISPVQAAGVVDVTVATPLGCSATSASDRFTYTAAANSPTVSSISPTSGSSGGGTSVTITGSNFTGATQVYFGNVLATSFTVNSATSITAVTPPQPAGGVDVRVVTANAISALASGDVFTYNAVVPTVTSVSPNTGLTTGNTQVVVSGTSFYGASAVKFGTTAALGFVVNSPTQITVTAPALSSGTYHVTVTGPGGTSTTSTADQYTAVTPPLPAVTGISPNNGPMAGGTSVTITGSNYTNVTAVTFGGVNATSYTVNSSTQITATAPAEVAGIVNVQVTTQSGSSAVVTADQYTYNAAAPTITSISPTNGPTAGGTSVTITGTNFTGGSAVYFGTSAALTFHVNSDSSLTAVSPLAAAGVVDITVVTANGTSATSAADQFTYQSNSSTPTVTSLSPTSGPAAGGTSVTITGTNLTGATAVFFGSVPATFTVNSSTSITATAPFQAAGTIDVTVTTYSGTSSTSAADHYTYNSVAPTVTAVSPNADTTAGGNYVTITGTNFTGATAVNFGSTAAAFWVNSNTSITALEPVHAAGTVDITVVTPSGTSGTSAADQFTYNCTANTPTVTAVSPSSGPTGGGTSVTLTGTNFTGATQVYFGSVAATSFTVNSSTSITATAPNQTAGTVDITVSTVYGVSASSAADHYTYNGTAPTVTAASPTSGPAAGGTQVTITGTNLNGATAVKFGSTAATSFTVISATQITATSPAGSAGTVDITVTTPYGTSAISSADQYTYVAAPTVTAVSPTSGTTAGGTSVTITGTNFTQLVSVSFGSVPASTITVNSSTQITASAPASGPGLIDVTVTNGAGTSLTSTADQFTFTATAPSITSVSPNSGTTNGGTSVTIAGSGFTSASGVFFGGTAATSFSVTSDTQITATSPAHAAGTVDIVVVTPLGGTSATSSSDQFTYNASAPTVTAVSPTSGPTVGGTSVTVTGTNFTGASAVMFGNVPATSFSVSSPTQLTAVSPVHGAGVVDITVTTAGGTSSTSASDQFTYVASAPTVTSVAPNSGSTAGGTFVLVTGSNFVGVSAVKFGASAAVTFGVLSPSMLVAVAPYHAAGTVDVTVTTGQGTSATSAADQFTYVTVLPQVTSIFPNTGAGGTQVAVFGTGFLGTSQVHFGTSLGMNLTVLTPGQLTVIAPPQGFGTVDVTVTTPSGTSPTSAADQFTYRGTAPGRSPVKLSPNLSALASQPTTQVGATPLNAPESSSVAVTLAGTPQQPLPTSHFGDVNRVARINATLGSFTPPNGSSNAPNAMNALFLSGGSDERVADQFWERIGTSGEARPSLVWNDTRWLPSVIVDEVFAFLAGALEADEC
jgi:hypothetical protein